LLDKNAISEHSWFRGYSFSSHELDFSLYGKTYIEGVLEQGAEKNQTASN